MKSLFDNEAHYYDIFHQDKDYASEAQKIKHRFPWAKTILEIGCGTGKLTKELERLNFEVTCVEPSKGMINFMKHRPEINPLHITLQDCIPPREVFDLALATYDVLNYIPFNEIGGVLTKLRLMSRVIHAEYWDPSLPVHPLRHKRADGCHRLRLGFRFRNIAYLWFIFWGRGLVISHHKLYLHILYL